MPPHLQRAPLFLAASGGMFMFGVVLALLGTLFGLPEMRDRLEVDYAGQGDLFLLQYFGILLANLIGGPAIDHFGHRIVLLVSALFVGVALLCFALADGFLAGALASLLLGMGGGALNTAATALVSDLYPERRGTMLSYLGIFFGVGALFIPLAQSTIAALFSVSELLLISAGLAFTVLLAYTVLSFPPARETSGFSLLETLRVARYPGVLIFGLVLFCQSGIEGAVGGWTSTYVGTRGADPELATLILAGYWAAMMIGRGASGFLLRSVRKDHLLQAAALGSLAGCIVLLWAERIEVMAGAVAWTGFCFAAVFPVTLALAGDRYERYAGSVFGLLFSIAVLGGMTFPWALGHIASRFSVRSGMWLPILGTAVIVLLTSIIRRIGRRQPASIGS